jgi:hypothetical protein
MSTKILHKKSTEPNKVPQPSDLTPGEIAINTADGKIFLKKDNNTILDTSKEIFDKETRLTASDDGQGNASIVGAISGSQKIQLSAAGIELDGSITVNSAETLFFNDNDNNKYVAIQAPDSVDFSYVIKLPDNQPARPGILTIDGQGNTAWGRTDTFGGNRIYVSDEYGDDSKDGISAPVKTLKKAAQLAASLGHKPIVNPGQAATNAKRLLEDNRLYVQRETIGFIDWNFVNFNDHYTQSEFESDFSLVIDAASYDLALGTNYNSITTGLAYQRDNREYLRTYQIIQTSAAIAFARDEASLVLAGDSTAQSFSDLSFDTVISILQNNLSSSDVLDFPAASMTTANQILAKDQLQANREFLQFEVIAFIQENYSNLDFNTEKYFRDVGFIIDALCYDIMYGGNHASVRAAEAYFVEVDSQLGSGEQNATVASYNYLSSIIGNIITAETSWTPINESTTQDISNSGAGIDEVIAAETRLQIIIDVIEAGSLNNLPAIVFPDVSSEPLFSSFSFLQTSKPTIITSTIQFISDTFNGFTYNGATCERDVGLIIDAVIYNLTLGGNNKAVEAGESYLNVSEVINNQKFETLLAIEFARDLSISIIKNQNFPAKYQNLVEQITWPQASGADAEQRVFELFTIVKDILETGISPLIVDAEFVTIPITILISSGDFYIDNPIIIPDNVSVVGDGIRSVVIRPLNANKDMFRVRNGAYLFGITFRDGLNQENVPTYTFNFAVAFDDPLDSSVDRIGYFGLSDEKPIITLSPYIQNCSIISFLGANGVLVDGSKVETPNQPINSIELENPIDLSDGLPEQGKSMVANAFTMISFGGTGWLVSNDGYAQIVSCFQIFCLTGSWSQSGGYLSITNSATNFGVYALRSSGYSSKSFEFDRGFIAATGTSAGIQTFTSIGTKREPISQYIIQIHDELNDNITSQFKEATTQVTFDAETDVDVNANVFTINSHGFFNGQRITYRTNDNDPILGLFDEATYFIQVISASTFTLFNDEGFGFPVNILAVSTGTHSFVLNAEEFFVENILSTHDDYQELVLPPDTYTFNAGDLLVGTTTGFENTAFVSSWNPATYTLVISNEFSIISEQPQKILFNSNSIIQSINGDSVNISIASASTIPRGTFFTTVFRALSTIEDNSLQGIANALGKRVKFHRPSIVNSSAHTWEFAGSGTDYNALPQNGGLGRGGIFEQYSELPGRVYSSGTNELGDFKVGDFIVAENKTGNILFRTQVAIGELTVLRLSLSDVEINEFSIDPGLGDNEPGGALNSRISTQRAIRTFIANRLGNVLDKQASSNAVPGALVQLNSQGQINSDLLPPARGITTYNVVGFGARLLLSTRIPPIEVISGDNASESYDQIQLELTDPITLQAGDFILQNNTNASGTVKVDVNNETLVQLVGPDLVDGFNTIDELILNDSSFLGAGSIPETAGEITTIVDNYFLRSDSSSQFLVLEPGITYNFSSISNITGANSGAQGFITAGPIYGVAFSLDITTLIPGSGYTPASSEIIYFDIPLTGGSGAGARADITVSSGQVSNVSLTAGGEGYVVGDILSADFEDIGGTAIDQFSIQVARADTRLFINLVGNFIKFAATPTSPEFIEDADSTSVSIPAQENITIFSFDARDESLGGAVDYTNSIFRIDDHGLDDGDAIQYDNNNNLNIGNLINQRTYWAKVIDSDRFEIYNNYAFTGGSKVLLGTSQTGTHRFNRFAVNIDTGTFYLQNHSLLAGEVIRYGSANPPSGVFNNGYYYIGSVTANGFTLHTNRSDAVASTGGTTVGAISFGTTGTGSANLQIQNVRIISTTNTSSAIEANWGRIAQATFDASNIVSGVLSTSRLAASGSASDKTFLRGDSAWKFAVQNIRPATSITPITISGDFFTESDINFYYDSITVDVNRVRGDRGTPNYTNVGVAAFNKTFFEVEEEDISGRVTIRPGVIDAGTLTGFTSDFFTNPANLIGTIPVSKGGTGLTTYTQGDLIFSGSNNSLTQLNIGAANTVLTSNGTIPAWSSNLTLGGTLTVSGIVSFNSTSPATSRTTGALRVSGGVGISGNLYALGLQGTSIGNVVASTGQFTSIEATGNVSLNGNNASINISPTGSGNVTISPAEVLTLGTATKTTDLIGNIVANKTQNINLSPNGIITINPINVSTINNTSIGASTRSTGAFTSLTSNGSTTFTANIAATSNTSGTLVVTGGIGVSGNLYATGIQDTPIGNTTRSTGAFTSITANSVSTFTSGTSSTSTTTGSVVVTGGLGVSENINAESVVTNSFTATNGVTLSTGTNIDQITTINVSLTLIRDWQDTGISDTVLATGSYYLQLYANDGAVDGGHTDVYYSGVMSWYAGTTSETTSDEIVLNRAGSSVGSGILYVRLLRTSGSPDNLKLQIAGNTINTGAANYLFKFRRII